MGISASSSLSLFDLDLLFFIKKQAPPLRREGTSCFFSSLSSASSTTTRTMAARNAALSFASSSSSGSSSSSSLLLHHHSSPSSSPPLLFLFARAASSKAEASRAAAAAGLTVYKPTTPGMRGRVITSRKDLWKGPPLKQLVGGVGRRGGRNATGRVTVRHRGGGHKAVLRAVDFWRVPSGSSDSNGSSSAVLRNSRCVFFFFQFFTPLFGPRLGAREKKNSTKERFSPLFLLPLLFPSSSPSQLFSLSSDRATVERLEYDPGRSAHIALVKAIGGGGESRGNEDEHEDSFDDDDDDDGGDEELGDFDSDEDESERRRRRTQQATRQQRQRRNARLPLSGKPGFVTADGRSYILAPAGLAPGDVVSSGPNSPILPGCALPLSDIPVGTPVHNVEILPGKGGQLARAAGAAAVVVSRGVPLSSSSSGEGFSSSSSSSTLSSSAAASPSSSASALAIDPNSYAIVRLPSGAQRRILARCYATVGALSNAAHKNRKLGKAGASRWSGRRPHVRGVAMNSVDHPMGGGRGKSKGRISQSPTGVPAKGKKTRDRKSRTDVFVHVERPRGKR